MVFSIRRRYSRHGGGGAVALDLLEPAVEELTELHIRPTRPLRLDVLDELPEGRVSRGGSAPVVP